MRAKKRGRLCRRERVPEKRYRVIWSMVQSLLDTVEVVSVDSSKWSESKSKSRCFIFLASHQMLQPSKCKLVAFALLLSALTTSTTAQTSNASLSLSSKFTRGPHHCAIRDSCGKKSIFGGEIPCPYNGLAESVSSLLRDLVVEIESSPTSDLLPLSFPL